MDALTVLVVEDDAMISAILAEMLEDMGHTVCGIAETEDEAVDAAANCAPALMIVDQNLRQGTGISVIERVRRDRPVPCIVTSGGPLRVNQAEVQVLQKPYQERDLVRAIDAATGFGGPANQAP